MHRENESFEVVSGYSIWKPASYLRVFGDDALMFLQGQFTNDLRQIATGNASFGLWLNHKGRVLGDSFIGREPLGSFWVVSYFTSAAAIRERLEAYIIADDVTLEDATADRMGVTLFGPAMEQKLFSELEGAVSFAGRRGKMPTTEWVFPARQLEVVRARLSACSELDTASLERLRILGAVPAVPMDIGPGELPNEGGLDQSAISYTKGCYLGQEVMARLKSMGQVRRKLLRVRGAAPVPALPATIYQGDRKVGELRTVAASGTGYVGLALFSLLNLKPEDALALTPGGGAALELDQAP